MTVVFEGNAGGRSALIFALGREKRQLADCQRSAGRGKHASRIPLSWERDPHFRLTTGDNRCEQTEHVQHDCLRRPRLHRCPDGYRRHNPVARKSCQFALFAVKHYLDLGDGRRYGWGLKAGRIEFLRQTGRSNGEPAAYAFHPVLKPNSRFTLNGLQHGIPNVSHTSGTLRF